MADHHISVTQLKCAVLDQAWREKWMAGEIPPTQSFPPPGALSAYGVKFHQEIENLVKFLTSAGQIKASAKLSGDELMNMVWGDWLQTFSEQLMASGKFEEATALTERFRIFCDRLVQLRTRTKNFQNWQDVFIASEHSLQNIVLKVGTKKVHVGAKIDAIRFHPKYHLEVVDYKLSQGNQQAADLVQLAIYSHLLGVWKPGSKFCGTIEYYLPEFQEVHVTPKELADLYTSMVEPVLKEMFDPGSKTGVQPEVKVISPSPTGDPGKKIEEDETSGTPSPQPNPAPNPTVSPNPASELVLGPIRGSGESLKLAPINLIRHTVVLGMNGSGKTTAGLNMLEQALLMGVPAILLDRKGDLCRYAQAAAWDDPGCPAELIETRKRLKEKLNIAVYTPGDRRGRGLRMPLTPGGLANLDAESKATIAQQSSATLADGLNYKADSPKRALLLLAFQVLTKRKPDGVLLSDLINIFAESDDELQAMRGLMASKIDNAVIQDLQTFKILNDRLQDPLVEQLDCRKFFQVKDGKVPLTIISTKFLGDDGTTSVWIAQLFLEILGFVSRNPSSKLQGLLMVDEADIYLPATRKPPTKGPMESLLKRGRSAGIGVMLLTQSPGDLDYKCRDNIRNWVMGLLTQKVALDKLSGVLSDAKTEPASLSKQRTGQFIFAAEGRATPFNSLRNCIETKQLSEDEILEVAKRSAGV